MRRKEGENRGRGKTRRKGSRRGRRDDEVEMKWWKREKREVEVVEREGLKKKKIYEGRLRNLTLKKGREKKFGQSHLCILTKKSSDIQQKQ